MQNAGHSKVYKKFPNQYVAEKATNFFREYCRDRMSNVSIISSSKDPRYALHVMSCPLRRCVLKSMKNSYCGIVNLVALRHMRTFC